MGHIVEIIAILTTIGLPVGLGIYLALRIEKQRHTERMELIKQGIIPPTTEKPAKNPMNRLRNGLILIGIGLGLAVSFFIQKTWQLDEDSQSLITAASILLFMGTAFLIYFFVSNKKSTETTEGK
ncbi:MAG TPA: DUF6249 domain-containing protein [Crocinitomicaceae bacterium]|nr:DUF6249 domain-containing protein [Crocinitomicaceae bacterium]